MGHIDHSQIILILDLVFQFEGAVADLFIEEFTKLPCWIFLKWLPQIMSYMTTSSYTYFVPIIKNLVRVYPEPCFYSLCVSTDDATSVKKQLSGGRLALREIFETSFKKFTTHHSFVRALECLVHPDQRLKTWMDAISEHCSNKQTLMVLKQGLIDDIFSLTDEFVGKKQGDFNLMFASDMAAYVRKYFGDNFEKIGEMDIPTI